jgi:hypothetical protein
LFRYFGIAFFLFIFYYFWYVFQIGLGDLRLAERYFIMLKQAMQHSPSTAAGLSIPVAEQSAKNTPCSLWIGLVKYKNHTAKTDTREFTNKHDVGYDLTAPLVVNASTGSPIALLQAHLKTANGY